MKRSHHEAKHPLYETEKAVRYSPDPKTGLSTQQVQQRIEAGVSNRTVTTEFSTKKQIIMKNTFTYFNLIFVILAALLTYVQSFKNMTFLPVVILNTVIGIVQEIRSKKILDQLNILSEAKIQVIRDGKQIAISQEALVLDDVIFFQAGEQIVADAVILSGEVRVNESLLTGESDEIKKSTTQPLLSGSFIVSGECYARIDKIAEDSYINQLTSKAKQMKTEEQSEMIDSINRLVKWVGLIIIPIGGLLFFQNFFVNHLMLKESVVSMVAALIGMIPEGLYLLTTLALTVSTVRLTKKQVLLHNMKSIETLARVDILCVDKTGTITEPTMTVETLLVLQQSEPFSEAQIKQELAQYCAAMRTDNQTMEALKAYVPTVQERKAIDTLPFSSVKKYGRVSFEEVTYFLGAPDILLADDQYQEALDSYAAEGFRVLLFAKATANIESPETSVPLAFILFRNPIRENATETFAYFAEQGVGIKVISGDNPTTVKSIAMKAGIQGAEQAIDARDLQTYEQQKEALQTYTVFGRVTPEQKKEFVEILKSLGHTVAMTGDGVNDILAMKEADCSIAMASGNTATAQASQVVLLDSDFSRMPEVVLEGRRIVNNIERSSSLFLVKNIFSLLLSVFAIVFAMTYPLQPTQITLISMFTIGIPSTFLALEPNEKRIEGSFLFNVLSKAIPGGVTDMLVVSAMVICGTILELTSENISTTATLLLVAVGFMVMFKICSPLNRYRKLVMLGCFFAMVLSSLLFRRLFSLGTVSATALLLLTILFFAADSIFKNLTLVSEIVQKRVYTKKHKRPTTADFFRWLKK